MTLKAAFMLAMLPAPVAAQQVLPQFGLDQNGPTKKVSVRDPSSNTMVPLGTIANGTFLPTPGGNTSLQGGALKTIYNGGSDQLTLYWGHALTGTYAPGAGPDGYSYTSGFMFDVPSDNRNVGSDFSVGLRVRQRFGGTGTVGGRIPLYVSGELIAPTDAGNGNRNYPALQASMYARTGDGGTNTGAGAKGDFFGAGLAAYAVGAANLNNLTGGEVNVFADTASSTRRLAGFTIIPAASIHGAEIDAMLSLSAQAGNVGQNYGLLFSDSNGGTPLNSASTLIGAKWLTYGVGGLFTIGTGVDLSAFTFASGDAVKIGSGNQVSWYSNATREAYVVGGAGNPTGLGGVLSFAALNGSLNPVAVSLNAYADNSFAPSAGLSLGAPANRWGSAYVTRVNSAAFTPPSSSAACAAGDQTWDANYVYVCVATNTWKRSALSSF